jgi:O-acetyl-ADP-ribose deacetylase (regulator of RNase III)
MSATIGECRLDLEVGDITLQEVDAIVNAANQHLAGGGGVDGAIHRRGGPEIMADTRRRYPKGCPTGSAVISMGGKLGARFVIHAVGPRWSDGKHGEPDLLRTAYLKSLELAAQQDCRSIALPALSTGAYGYPMGAASKVALTAAIEFLKSKPGVLKQVKFVLFDEGTYQVFARTLQELLPDSPNSGS